MPPLRGWCVRIVGCGVQLRLRPQFVRQKQRQIFAYVRRHLRKAKLGKANSQKPTNQNQQTKKPRATGSRTKNHELKAMPPKPRAKTATTAFPPYRFS